MNSSTTNRGSPGIVSEYSTGLAFVVLILFIMVALAAYLCPCGAQEPSTRTTTNQANSITDRGSSTVIEIGLDEATLASYPKLLYSQAELQHMADGSQPSSCSICLGDYNDNDMLRLLPDCGHVFHLKCVDCWLRRHPTCPICRKSPLPTPLAEVATLDASR